VWGPYAVRNKKRLKLGGFHITDGGVFERCEQFGPPCLETWMKAYKVLHTCLVMSDSVLPSQLEQYAALIKGYHDDFGSKCWPTIYQADVRCRQERMQALRRKIVMIHNDSPNLAAAQGFDPLHPWRYVWKAACDDMNFWFRSVQQKCLLLATGSINMSAMIDGDVLVSGGFDAGGSRASGSSGPPPPPPKRGAGGRGPPPPPAKKQKRLPTHHEVDSSTNLLTVNRYGKGFCHAFQRGECKGRTCSVNPKYVHQCARCLSNAHGAHHPTECSAPLAQDKRGKGGKGGKGR
jgi:hypothetical protein